MALVRWTPLRGIVGFRDEVDRLLDELYRGMGSAQEICEGDWCPAIDLAEKDGEMAVSVELPGMNREDIKVTVEDDVLTVTGEKKAETTESGENYRRVERTYGSFKRSITLPSSVDAEKVKAAYRDGVLKITLPKVESEKPREIPIQAS